MTAKDLLAAHVIEVTIPQAGGVVVADPRWRARGVAEALDRSTSRSSSPEPREPCGSG